MPKSRRMSRERINLEIIPEVIVTEPVIEECPLEPEIQSDERHNLGFHEPEGPAMEYLQVPPPLSTTSSMSSMSSLNDDDCILNMTTKGAYGLVFGSLGAVALIGLILIICFLVRLIISEVQSILEEVVGVIGTGTERPENTSSLSEII